MYLYLFYVEFYKGLTLELAVKIFYTDRPLSNALRGFKKKNVINSTFIVVVAYCISLCSGKINLVLYGHIYV